MNRSRIRLVSDLEPMQSFSLVLGVRIVSKKRTHTIQIGLEFFREGAVDELLASGAAKETASGKRIALRVKELADSESLNYEDYMSARTAARNRVLGKFGKEGSTTSTSTAESFEDLAEL